MPKYILENAVIFSDGLHPKGEVIELSETDAKGYVERGSIRPYIEGEEDKAEEPTSVEGETLREFELNGFTYKQLQTIEGVRYTQDGVEISEDAFVNQFQIKTREDEEARVASETPENTDEATQAPVPPTVGTDPTQEQIDADLKAAGV